MLSHILFVFAIFRWREGLLIRSRPQCFCENAGCQPCVVGQAVADRASSWQVRIPLPWLFGKFIVCLALEKKIVNSIYQVINGLHMAFLFPILFYLYETVRQMLFLLMK